MATEYERRKANYDQILFRVKKGKQAEYKAKAAALGLSLWELIQRGVESYGGEGTPNVPTVKPALMEPQLTAEQKKILDAVDTLPLSARKTLLKFLQSLQDKQGDEKATVD